MDLNNNFRPTGSEAKYKYDPEEKVMNCLSSGFFVSNITLYIVSKQ